MRITTIGTGTAAPHPKRAQAGTLIEVGDVRLLIDCGSARRAADGGTGIAWQHDHPRRQYALSRRSHHGHRDADLRLALRQLPAEVRTGRSSSVRRASQALIESMKAAFGEALLDTPPPISITELPAGRESSARRATSFCSRHKVPHTRGECGIFPSADAGVAWS